MFFRFCCSFKVIFTTNKDLKFTKLETKRCLEYNSRYKIYFENELCLTEFYRLQEFRCQICFNDDTLFSNLKELELHLRKEHDLFLCELCVNHLKIFPSERKYYSRKDLARHKKTGDPDNKSYKGHSSCHLCNTMFFDEEELLSHLKKDHYNCHFCDPSRIKMFFDNYQSLKQHFLDQHYICQEGFCRDEEITSAFANKFDLAAHKAQVHGGKISRAARVDLDIDFREGPNGLPQTTVSYTHSNNNNYDLNDSESGNETPVNQSIPTQEDFPQLATPSSAAVGGSSNYASMTKNVTGLKKTNFSKKFQPPTSNTEDFPALASASTTSSLPSFAQKKFPAVKPKQPTIASLRKGKSSSSKNNQQSQTSNLKYADIASSFPPLAQHTGVNESWNKPLPTFTQDDFPDMPIKVKKTKKKTQYVNVRKEAEVQKRKEEEEAKKLENESTNSSNNTTDLKDSQQQQPNTSNPPNPLTNDGKMLSLKVPPGLHKLTQQEQMNNIKKLPPGFQPHHVLSNDTFNLNSINHATNDLLINTENDRLNNVSNDRPNDRMNDRSKTNQTTANGNNDSNKNLPSSSRTGYIYPSNFNERNENLLKLIRHELRTDNKFDQFRNLTDKFIRSHVDGDFYFRRCLDLFDKSFLTSIFSELLVLMPHIKKQNEILAAYERYFNYNKGAMQNKQRNQDGSKGVWILTNEKVEFLACPVCTQILKRDGKDGSEHMTNHGDWQLKIN